MVWYPPHAVTRSNEKRVQNPAAVPEIAQVHCQCLRL